MIRCPEGKPYKIQTSGRIMALGSIQPLTERITWNISWGKGGQCVRMTADSATVAPVEQQSIAVLHSRQ